MYRTKFISLARGCSLCLIATAVVFAFLATESQAATKFKTGVSLQQTAAGTQIKVTLTSSRSVASRKKPRKVKIRAAGKTVKLKRVNAASAAAGYASSWQSSVFTGAYAAKLNALNGKRLKITIASRAGTTIARPKAVVQTGSGGGGGGGGPIFTGPATQLNGADAFNHFSKWFLNSAFSDCAAGVWPACGGFEERYIHCSSGEWEYHRNTVTSGADTHSYSNFTVTGADAFVDGSWAVAYDENVFGGKYVWQVSNTGIATGQYQSSGGSVQNLGPLYWSQPAVTWQETSGACGA
jgi:hypothetical protein